jgi:hypothetical protein
MSVREFVEWDDGTEIRYELIAGEVVAITPFDPCHGTITGNVIGGVGLRLEGRSPHAGVALGGLWIDNENFYVADVVTTRDPPRRGLHREPDPYRRRHHRREREG